jgi:hypothetical protein
MGTQGLREARTTQRNAPGETFGAFAIVHRAESQWFAGPWQTPLDVYVSPCFARSRKQVERFTVVRNTYSKGPSFTSYRAILLHIKEPLADWCCVKAFGISIKWSRAASQIDQ